jgi:hypothetical protein
MTTLLIVSPHLDDAVLSCAGAIHTHVRRGDQVIVATVFTQGHEHAQRRAEDLRAVASLGAVALHLGLLDAPERLRCDRTHRALVEEAPLREADVAWVQGVIDAAIRRVRPTQVWGPLGVGGHIDHRVVHAALGAHGSGAAASSDGVVFYEDRPYAFLAGAVRRRLSDLGLSLLGPPESGTATARDLLRAPDPAIVREGLQTLPHLRSHLAEEDGGQRARSWLASRLCAVAPEQDSHHHVDPAGVVARVTCHDAETAEAAARAMCLYESQIPDLFGKPARVASALRAAALGLAPATASSPSHAERTFAIGAAQ